MPGQAVPQHRAAGGQLRAARTCRVPLQPDEAEHTSGALQPGTEPGTADRSIYPAASQAGLPAARGCRQGVPADTIFLVRRSFVCGSRQAGAAARR